MATMLKGSLALALTFALAVGLAGCATRVGPTRGGAQSSTTAIPYALTRSYFRVGVEEAANGSALQVRLKGPFTEADPSTMRGLDLDHSGLAADRFQVFTDPSTGLLQTITISSDSRLNEIAYAAGRAAGYGLGFSGDAATADQHGGPGYLVIFNTRWRLIENSSQADVERNRVEAAVNGVIAQWYAARCVRTPPRPTNPPTRTAANAPPPPPLCRPATAPRFTLSGAVDAAPAEAFSADVCSRAICYSSPARATLRFGIVPPPAPDQYTAAYLPVTREISTYVYNPAAPGHIKLEHPGPGGGNTFLQFGDGALIFVEHSRESEIESAVRLPLDLVMGIAHGVVAAIPFRFWYVHQTRELGRAERGGDIPQDLRSASTQNTAQSAPAAVPGAAVPSNSGNGGFFSQGVGDAMISRIRNDERREEVTVLVACLEANGCASAAPPPVDRREGEDLPSEPTR